MSRSYIIYINREGRHSIFCWVYVYQTPPKKKKKEKKHHMWTQSRWQPPGYCPCFLEQGVYKPSVTDARVMSSCPIPSSNVAVRCARRWLFIRGWGCLPHHSCFYTVVVWQRNQLHLFFIVYVLFFFFPCMFSTAATTADWSERIMSCLF